MTPLYTASQMRELDRLTIQEIGVPGVVLMEHAGYKSALILADCIDTHQARVAVVCGKGNNGGDGYVVARWMMHWGYDVTVFSLCPIENLKGDARVNADIFARLYPERLKVVKDPKTQLATELAGYDAVVDAIFGTGLSKKAEGIYGDAISAINSSGAFVFSIDIPSGLPSDSGKVIGPTVVADATATFGGLKRAHMIYPAKEFVGRVYLVDIGIPPAARETVEADCLLVEEEDVAVLFPRRRRDAHKGHYGHIAILCGSPGKTGAGIMAGEAALRAGAGLVTLFVPEELNTAYEANTLEVMTLPLPSVEGHISSKAFDRIMEELGNKDALAIGPGLGQHPETQRLLEMLLKEVTIPMVIDADGINLIARNPSMLEAKRADVILTPHPGEFSRLTGVPISKVNGERLEVATQWAKRLNVVIVLKGASTVVASPDGTAFVNPTGNPGMATGGSGDVLTGLISWFLAMTGSPEEAAVAGVFLHGLAGDVMAEELGEYPLTAGDIIGGVSEVVREWERGEGVWKGCYESL